MPITSRRKGPYLKSRGEANRKFALGRLRAKWRSASVAELETQLRLILIAERYCVPKIEWRTAPTVRWLYPRLRRRRLEIAQLVALSGGRVNVQVFSRVLPKWRQWPGVLALVGKKAAVGAVGSDG